MKKSYGEYLEEEPKRFNLTWKEMSNNQRLFAKHCAMEKMLNDLSARISKLESQPDRPAFHVDQELVDAAEKAKVAFEEEEKEKECEKWEYMRQRGDIGMTACNELGLSGWEVCGIRSWEEGGINQYATWFKRKI